MFRLVSKRCRIEYQTTNEVREFSITEAALSRFRGRRWRQIYDNFGLWETKVIVNCIFELLITQFELLRSYLLAFVQFSLHNDWRVTSTVPVPGFSANNIINRTRINDDPCLRKEELVLNLGIWTGSVTVIITYLSRLRTVRLFTYHQFFPGPTDSTQCEAGAIRKTDYLSFRSENSWSSSRVVDVLRIQKRFMHRQFFSSVYRY